VTTELRAAVRRDATMSAPHRERGCGASSTQDSGVFALTGVDVPDSDKPKEKTPKKRRGAKKKDADEDWLAELHAMHSEVGTCFGEEEKKEDKQFFAEARRTEQEVEQLGKELEFDDA